ncbi:hypothetical protein AB0T83_20150, partial [Fluviibacterium sp. DFM31]
GARPASSSGPKPKPLRCPVKRGLDHRPSRRQNKNLGKKFKKKQQWERLIYCFGCTDFRAIEL